MNSATRCAGQLIGLLVAVGLLAGLAAAAAIAATVRQADVRPAFGGDGLLVILAIGSDTGPPHRPGDPLHGRADGVHLLAVDPATRRATIVNIPRDSLVSGSKLTDLLTRQGPEGLTATMTAFTGVEIDYWALMTFQSIEKAVAGLGGVEVTIEQPMHDPFSGSNFEPGPRRLSGHEALAFVRDRKSVPGGDFGRTRNHGRLLRAAHAQLREQSTALPALTRKVGLFSRTTVTNIPASELLNLAFLALAIDPAHVRQDALEGSFGTGPGGSSAVHLRTGGSFERIRAGQVGP